MLERGATVIAVDNYFTGAQQNIAHLLKHPRFSLLHRDIIEPLSVEVGEIYNLACPASPVHYQSDPIYTVKANVIGALNLLDLAKRCGARVLQASTSEVYGDPLVHPQVESYWGNVNLTGPRACYDEGKRCAETFFFDYNQRFGIEVKIARIFNTYGPRMHREDGRIVSNFIVQALTGKPLTVHGDGSQTRSFCYVSDLIEGLVRLMESPAALIGPINLGNPTELPVLEIAQTILARTGSSSTIAFGPLPTDDPQRRRPDISKAARELGWRPFVPLEAGLDLTIGYFRALLARESRPRPAATARCGQRQRSVILEGSPG